MRRAFALPDFIEIEDRELANRRKSIMVTSFPVPPVNGLLPVGPVPAPSVPTYFGDSVMDEPWPNELLTLRVTKVGLLLRKGRSVMGPCIALHSTDYVSQMKQWMEGSGLAQESGGNLVSC